MKTSERKFEPGVCNWGYCRDRAAYRHLVGNTKREYCHEHSGMADRLMKSVRRASAAIMRHVAHKLDKADRMRGGHGATFQWQIRRNEKRDAARAVQS